MTKAELIRKIAKRAGVPDSEAKIFFEIFLKKSSELLAPGQAVFLKGFGHFQFKKGKIRTEINAGINRQRESIFVDLMAYYPVRQSEEETQENLIFNIPALQFENFNPIDAHFSLSFGKPVIPIKGVKLNEIFIPLTGLELRKLVEAKVEKLVNELEIIKEYTKGSEILVIEADSFKSHQLEFKWGEVPSGDISGSKNSDDKSKTERGIIEESEISWDFGEDISRQIEEESILDMDKTDEFSLSETDEEDENVSWDFGATSIDENIPPDRDEEFIDAVPAKVDNSEKESKGITDRFEKIEASEEDETFERVKPVSSGFLDEEENKTTEKEDIHWDNIKENAEYEKFEPETRLTLDEEEDAPEIKETNKTVQFNEDFEKIPGEETISEEQEEEQNEFGEIVESGGDKPGAEDADTTSYSASKIIEKRKEREAYYSRRNSSPIFIIALIVIILVAVALYFYLNGTFSEKDKSLKEIPAGINNVQPEIVERDFSVPVTYPYTKNADGTNSPVNSISEKVVNRVENNKPAESENKKTQTLKKESAKTNSTLSKSKINNLIEKTEPKVDVNNPSSFTFENLPPPADSVKLHDKVAADNGSFTVQVSSWKSRSIALSQVAKFKANGYEAYIEKAEIAGKGTWYRVKVKNFKTQREAEDFLLSNQ